MKTLPCYGEHLASLAADGVYLPFTGISPSKADLSRARLPFTGPGPADHALDAARLALIADDAGDARRWFQVARGYWNDAFDPAPVVETCLLDPDRDPRDFD